MVFVQLSSGAILPKSAVSPAPASGMPQTSLPQTSGVQPENSVLRSQLNKPPMTANPLQNQLPLMQQQQRMQQQQQQQQQGELLEAGGVHGYRQSHVANQILLLQLV